MLYFIPAWILLFGVCGVVGLALLNQLQADRFERTGDRLIVAEWLGLIALAVTLLAASLLLSLTPAVGAMVMLGLSALALLSRQTRREVQQLWARRTPALLSAGLGLAVAIAAITAREVTWIDTGLYHYSVIQWFSRFGSVPGLALLYSNFGFTSSWFALSAPFNPAALEARAIALVNGFALLLVVVQFCISLSRTARQEAQLSDWFILAFSGMLLPLVMGTSLLFDILISPSPDLPILFLIGLVGWAMLIAASPSSVPGSALVPLLLAVGAVTVKLIAIPTVLVASLFSVVGARFDLRRIVQGGAIALLFLAPFLLSSIVTSGCPLYPSSLFCLDLSWSPAAQNLERVASDTHNWTSWYGSPPDGTNPVLWWLSRWLMASRLNILMALLIGCSAIAAVFVARSVKAWKEIRGQLWVAAIAAVGIAFIMKTSPLFRFALAYATMLPALLVALCCQRWFPSGFRLRAIEPLGQLYRRSQRVWLLFPLFLLALVGAGAGARPPLFHVLLPPPLQQVPTAQKQVNNLTYNSPQPQGELCWATELPCAFTVAPDVQLRNPDRGMDAGFVRQPTQNEPSTEQP